MRASPLLSWVALWALGFVRASVRAHNGGCGSGSSLTLAMAVVEHKRPEFRPGETFIECDKDVLVQKELKSRENRRTAKRSWQKLGCQIRGHLRPHTLHKSKLAAVEVSGADDGSWSRIDTKEQVEALLIDRNVEQFSYAGNTPFGYTTLGDELGHTSDTQVIH
jgi:hypothetical protein